MSTDSDIRTTLRRVAEGADAPFIDEAGFERRVRRHRVRRRAGLAAATAAVAAVALAVPLTMSQIGTENGATGIPAAAGPSSPNPPAYFVLGNRAVMLDGDGGVHDLDVRAEAIVGPTTEGVLVVGRESRLVHLAVSRERGEWTVERIEPPTTEPVDSAAVSADGTRVATVDLAGDLVIRDLASGHEQSRTPSTGSSIFIEDFADRVLYRDGGTLRLGTEGDAVEIPVEDPERAAAGGETVAVNKAGVTRMYDVSDGTAIEVGSVSDVLGDLSPDGRYYLATGEGGDPMLWDREGGEPRPMTGLVGGFGQVRWLDDDTALVATGALRRGDQVSLLVACEVATLRCQEVHDAGTSKLWLQR